MIRILIAAIFLIPVAVAAHGDSESFELVKDGYLVDVGYNAEFVEGETVRFELDLFKEGGDIPVPFSRAWVRVNKDKGVIFAGSISDTDFGKPGFSLAFEQAGPYTLFVRYENDEDSIVEAEFPILVSGDSEKRGASPFAAMLIGSIGFLAGGVAGLFIGKKIA